MGAGARLAAASHCCLPCLAQACHRPAWLRSLHCAFGPNQHVVPAGGWHARPVTVRPRYRWRLKPCAGVLCTGAGVSLCPGSSTCRRANPRAGPHAGLRFTPACATRSRLALHNQITQAHATSQPPAPRPCYSSTISPPHNRPRAQSAPQQSTPHGFCQLKT